MEKTATKAKAAPATKPDAPKRSSPSVNGQNVKSIDHGRNSWHVAMRPEFTIDDLTRPELLANAVERLKAGDAVEFANSDLSIFAQGVILATDPVSRLVWVHLLIVLDLKAKLAASAAPDFSAAVVEQVGDGWRVRIENRALRSGFPTQAAAMAWIHDKKIGAHGDFWAERPAA